MSALHRLIRPHRSLPLASRVARVEEPWPIPSLHKGSPWSRVPAAASAPRSRPLPRPRFPVYRGRPRPGPMSRQAEGVIAIELDVTDQASIDAAAKAIGDDPPARRAGQQRRRLRHPRSIAESDLEDASATVETNTFGALRVAQAMVPLLRKSDDARVVNVSAGRPAQRHERRLDWLPDVEGGAQRDHPGAFRRGGLPRQLDLPRLGRHRHGRSRRPASVAEGADTAGGCATDPEAGTGGFYRDRSPIPW